MWKSCGGSTWPQRFAPLGTSMTSRSTLGRKPQDQRDQTLQETPIDSINQLESTIQGIGFSLPDASDELAEVIELRDKVDELLTKNRDLGDLRCQAQAKKAKGSMGRLLQTQGLKDWAQKLDNACHVLETCEANISRLTKFRHDGESIPVEVEYQKEFLQLLKAAAKDRDKITSHLHAMEWIAQTRETTSSWRKSFDAQLEAGTSLEAAWYEQQKLDELVKGFTQNSYSSEISQLKNLGGQSLEGSGAHTSKQKSMMDLG